MLEAGLLLGAGRVVVRADLDSAGDERVHENLPVWWLDEVLAGVPVVQRVVVKLASLGEAVEHSHRLDTAVASLVEELGRQSGGELGQALVSPQVVRVAQVVRVVLGHEAEDVELHALARRLFGLLDAGVEANALGVCLQATPVDALLVKLLVRRLLLLACLPSEDHFEAENRDEEEAADEDRGHLELVHLVTSLCA